MFSLCYIRALLSEHSVVNEQESPIATLICYFLELTGARWIVLKNRRKFAVWSVLSVLLVVSLIFNWHQYKQAQSMNNAAYGWGFYYVFSGIGTADEIFHGQLPNQDTVDGVRYLSEAAGQFQATSRVMREMGVDHLLGIGIRLDEAAKVISHPDRYSAAQINQNKEFVHTVVMDFKPCWNAQYLIKSRLPGAIDKIYNAMTPQERKQLYPMY